ncbi:MAG: hypothetical protein P8181_14115, partial [bacterium]
MVSNRPDRIAGAPLGILLGSGLGAVSGRFEQEAALPFADIPGLDGAGVAGHDGEIRRCRVQGEPCLFICGRTHTYEGRADDIRHLIEFVHRAGVRRLVVTSAAGSLVKSIYPGELVLIEDIVDVQSRLPTGYERAGGPLSVNGASGAGRPDPHTTDRKRSGAAHRVLAGRMHLDPELNRRLWLAGSLARVALGRGTAAVCAGPVYETPAEIGMLRHSGASVVTMSGAPEVTAANTLGIRPAMIA